MAPPYDPTADPVGPFDATSAFVRGFADNVPLNLNLTLRLSANPGGPYNLAVSNALAGANIPGQFITAFFQNLQPDTQYWFRLEIRDGGELLVQASEEATFTTEPGSANGAIGGLVIQPCCSATGSGPSEPVDVNVLSLPEPVDVNVLGTVSVVEPVDVNVLGTVTVVEPIDVNVLGTVSVAEPVTVDGTVSVNEPVDVNVLTMPVVTIAEPVTVDGTVSIAGTVPVSITGQPISVTGTVTGTVSTGGSTAASATLTTATAVANGTTVDFANAKHDVTLFILVNGTVTGGVVRLEGSQDGTNFTKIADSAQLATGVNQYLAMSGGAFRWFRGSITETVAGGGTVTATLMFA